MGLNGATQVLEDINSICGHFNGNIQSVTWVSISLRIPNVAERWWRQSVGKRK